MTVETYVYAIVGVYCKDKCTSKDETVRGCDHPEAETDYCAECGNKMWTKNRVQTCLSDKLEHLQEWYGYGEDGDGNELGADETAISMIYCPMTGPTEFVVGRVLESMDSGDCVPTTFNTLSPEEYADAFDQTKAALEPLGLWDAEKFGYMLYAISM